MPLVGEAFSTDSLGRAGFLGGMEGSVRRCITALLVFLISATLNSGIRSQEYPQHATFPSEGDVLGIGAAISTDGWNALALNYRGMFRNGGIHTPLHTAADVSCAAGIGPGNRGVLAEDMSSDPKIRTYGEDSLEKLMRGDPARGVGGKHTVEEILANSSHRSSSTVTISFVILGKKFMRLYGVGCKINVARYCSGDSAYLRMQLTLT